MVKKAAYATPNHLLKAARLERGWTQQQVADHIGAPLSLNVSRWENGTAFPSTYYIERLCQLFGKSLRELGLSQVAEERQSESSLPSVSVERMPSSSAQETWQEERAEPPTHGLYRANLLAFRDNSLPLPLTPLIGREGDVLEVCTLLRRPEVRLVTLTGTGGIGKTRLALQVATELRADFADGVRFVSLAGIEDAALVASAIAQALGLKESEHHTPLDLVQAALGEKRLLLLLDNFERLLPSAPQLTTLLNGCQHLKMLVTSRSVLHLQGEYEFPLFPLTLPPLVPLPTMQALASTPAVTLFLQRAQAVRPTFQLRESNAQAIAEICVRLDGLPLAIELAAARSKLLSPHELLVRLSHRLEILTGGSQDLPLRQQTLRDTITWSYQLLPVPEQRFFRQLSVFAGGYTLEAAEAVCSALDGEGGARHLLEHVTSLLDKSLLQTIQQEGKESRLLMLETIREYGLDCLAASGELEETCRAHALYYLQLAEEAETKLRGPQQTEWLGRLEREHDNLHTALQWALEHEERSLALRIASALLDFWLLQGHVGEGYTGLSRALVNSEGIEAQVLAKAFSASGWLAWAQGDLSQAEEWCQKSLALYRKEGEAPGIALSLYRLGWVGILRGDHARALLLLEESLADFRELNDSLGIGDALRALGNISLIQGEYARGSALLEESLMLYRQVDYPLGVAEALNLLARALLFEGELARAGALLEEGLALFRQIGYKQGLAFALLTKGFVVFGLGADATSRAVARSLLEEGLALARVGRWRQNMIWGIHGLGLVAFFEQDYGTARSHFEEGLTLCLQVGNRTFAAFYLEGLTMTVAAQGQPAWAAQLWGAAQRLRQTINAAMPTFVRPLYKRLEMNLQAQLGEDAFRAFKEQGETMSIDQVMGVGETSGGFSPGRSNATQ